VVVGLPAGTQIGNHSGGICDSIAVMPVYPLPAPPQGCYILAAFNFQPDNNTFNPPIQITLKYDPNLIPWGMDDSNVVIAVLDEGTGEWEFLVGTLDAVSNTASFTITHFTVYGLLAAPAEPALSPSGELDATILIGMIGGIVLLVGILALVWLISGRSHKVKPSSK